MGESPLEIDANAEELYFVSMRIGKLEALQNSHNLKVLRLRNNLIKKIEGLEVCVQLQELELYDNQITVIENLAHLTNITILDLSYNNIKKIEGLDTLIHI
jgi:protein phosphatase 1 regulatory subunit 7